MYSVWHWKIVTQPHICPVPKPISHTGCIFFFFTKPIFYICPCYKITLSHPTCTWKQNTFTANLSNFGHEGIDVLLIAFCGHIFQYYLEYFVNFLWTYLHLPILCRIFCIYLFCGYIWQYYVECLVYVSFNIDILYCRKMGLMSDPKKRQKILDVISKYNNKLCVLCYVAGAIWFLALAYQPLNARTYFSENALLPGMICWIY